MPPDTPPSPPPGAPRGVAGATGSLQIIVIVVGDDEYALPIGRVKEVVRYTRPRPLPHSDRHVRGAIDLRGRVIPVVSARASFGLPDATDLSEAKIAILQLEDTQVGLIVDDVVEVLNVDPKMAVPPPDRAGEGAAQAIEVMVRLKDRLLAVLDVDGLLDAARRGIALGLETLAEPGDEVPVPAPEPPVRAEERPPRPRAVDPTDIAAVRAVFAMMEEHEERALDLFSQRLGDVDPGLRLRLGLDDPMRGRRFMAAVRLCVRGLDQLDELVPSLAALDIRVGADAIISGDGPTAIDAFLWTLKRGLGRRFDDERRRACEAAGRSLLEILVQANAER